MDTSWEDMSYRHLLDEFAAGKPTPGGGAGAAMAGALGSALVSMVCNLTLGRKKYADVQEHMERALKRAGELRDEFLVLARRDAEAFNRVMDAYRLPRETPEDKKQRAQEIQKGLKGATEVPLQVMRTSMELIRLGKEVLEHGNKNAASDAAASVRLGAAALTIGRYNVYINLAGIKDAPYREKSEREAEEMESESKRIAGEVERIFRHQVS